jgi:hypothetical protein
MRFLLLTRTDWEEPPRARHQLAKELAKNNEVVFVSINKRGVPKITISSPQKNIVLVTPYWYIHGKYVHRFPVLNELYQIWLYRKLDKKYSNHHIINFDVSASLVHNYFDDVVYFCNDNFLEKKRSKFLVTKQYFKLSQKRIATRARFCTAVSEFLKEQLIVYNPATFLILTAAEQLNVKNLTRDTNSKIVKAIYVGWLSKINTDWILELAKNKNLHIQLIGPYTSSDVEKLSGIDNIEILGKKIGKELDFYISSADICLAPYQKGDDTERVYTMPNKFWLYLNYGKPIVTCTIKRLYQLPDGFVYQANTKLEFVKSFNQAVLNNSRYLQRERQKFIKLNNWENRVMQILELYSRTKKLN